MSYESLRNHGNNPLIHPHRCVGWTVELPRQVQYTPHQPGHYTIVTCTSVRVRDLNHRNHKLWTVI